MDASNNPKHVPKVKKPVLLAPSAGKATPSPSPTKVTWDAENNRKLFLLTFGRSITASEHAQLSKAFPGSTTSSIRNRLGALRAEMRKLHESLEYEVPGVSGKKVSATPDKKSSAFLKRGVDEVDESEEGFATPSKRQRWLRIRDPSHSPRRPRRRRQLVRLPKILKTRCRVNIPA